LDFDSFYIDTLELDNVTGKWCCDLWQSL